MDLELDQLELRYEALRVRSPERERRLLASLSEVGQIMPVVVVRPGDGSQRAVLIDGYRRVRALRRLRRDVAHAMQWELSEVDALLLRRSLSIGNGETSLEQAWLLEELRERFSLSLQDLARRFDRTSSWVSPPVTNEQPLRHQGTDRASWNFSPARILIRSRTG